MILDCQKLRKFRKARKLTQEQAAKGANLAGRQRWNDIESGRHTNITLETLENIAGSLGVKPKDLLK